MFGVISWNVRGLGGRVKRRVARKLIKDWKVDVLCIQETKLEMMDASCIRQIWGNCNAQFEWVKSEGSVGGLCLIWDVNFFTKIDCILGDRFILVAGSIVKNNFPCVIGTIYAPNDDGERRYLWNHLLFLKG
ncbi:hypothetical protein L1049_011409 [Liquidambar formosana]|uniref:Endonuclease/exonuclease/phosphatase domain-containing protein n=1 Tax=Liquidambar formosana TaxID=63359 RepID=A0AAP0RY28_LIQFO